MSKWYCEGCHRHRYSKDMRPCRDCCGYRASVDQPTNPTHAVQVGEQQEAS